MNPWLTKFVASQASIIQTTVPEEPQQKDRKGRKKSKFGTKDGKHPFGDDDAFNRICHEKPPKKEVLNYFRDRIAALVAEEEF
jgi:hypothetical protein